MIDDFVEHLGGLEEAFNWAILRGANCMRCGKPLKKMTVEHARFRQDPAKYHVYFECEKCGRENELGGLMEVYDTRNSFFLLGKEADSG